MCMKYKTRRKNNTLHYFDTRDYIIENDIRNSFLILYIYDIFTSLSICKSKTQVIVLDI